MFIFLSLFVTSAGVERTQTHTALLSLIFCLFAPVFFFFFFSSFSALNMRGSGGLLKRDHSRGSSHCAGSLNVPHPSLLTSSSLPWLRRSCAGAQGQTLAAQGSPLPPQATFPQMWAMTPPHSRPPFLPHSTLCSPIVSPTHA